MDRPKSVLLDFSVDPSAITYFFIIRINSHLIPSIFYSKLAAPIIPASFPSAAVSISGSLSFKNLMQ
mgnify:CR=1 FL=1